MKKMFFALLSGCFFLAHLLPSYVTLLHEFTDSTSDGSYPSGSLILSGSTLFGMTPHGGASDKGTIFKIQADGSGFVLLHSFAGGGGDGANPEGSLILSGSTLYGMTCAGGDSDYGTIFKIQSSGGGFSLLHEFNGGSNDGWSPAGDLLLSGSTLYGMTPYGGDGDVGMVFSIQTDGTNFTMLHEFAGSADDGAKPEGSLILSGSTLLGMTRNGGDTDYGTIFKIQTDGTGFALLHEFNGGGADGASPYGSLLLSGSTLFGMTSAGGEGEHGTIFKIQASGTGFSLIHELAGDGGEGTYPYGSLTLSGSTLFGICYKGGFSNNGTVFKIQTNGTDYTLLHEFAGGADDGSTSSGDVLLAGSILYGMAENGGDSGDGVIFALPIALKEDFIGTWDEQGVYYRDSETAGWVKLASPATLVTSGDLDGDGIDDLLGIWPGQGGVWVKYSQSGSWAKLSSTAVDICTGDMNGDGRDDFLASWDGQGVYYRNSIGGAWVKLATPAEQVTAGDLDGDGIDDVIGIWPSQGGVWVKYSQSGSWAKLSSTAIDISAGDMNGDGRDDLLATWDVQGVYYKDSIGGGWVKMATPATLVAAGDLDGDGTADLIGIWPGQGGVWVKYSESGSWAKLSSTARHIATGLMHDGNW